MKETQRLTPFLTKIKVEFPLGWPGCIPLLWQSRLLQLWGEGLACKTFSALWEFSFYFVLNILAYYISCCWQQQFVSSFAPYKLPLFCPLASKSDHFHFLLTSVDPQAVLPCASQVAISFPLFCWLTKDSHHFLSHLRWSLRRPPPNVDKEWPLSLSTVRRLDIHITFTF